MPEPIYTSRTTRGPTLDINLVTIKSKFLILKSIKSKFLTLSRTLVSEFWTFSSRARLLRKSATVRDRDADFASRLLHFGLTPSSFLGELANSGQVVSGHSLAASLSHALQAPSSVLRASDANAFQPSLLSLTSSADAGCPDGRVNPLNQSAVRCEGFEEFEG
nr:hypothetical protein Iba_chr01eCG7510 [Ipomoea batatas]